MSRKTRWMRWPVLAAVAVLATWQPWLGETPKPERATIGDVGVVDSAYDRWSVSLAGSEGAGRLDVPLGYSRGLSAHRTEARGMASIDLADGTVSVHVDELEGDGPHIVWMVDRREDDPNRTLRLGDLESSDENGWALETELDADALWGFELDRIVVAEAGDTAPERGILFGSPSLFQRLYFDDLRGGGLETAAAGDAPFSFLVPRPAVAAGGSGLEALVAEGETLFMDETFGGNGRTCGTCHPADNNFTIDPAFIATLPATDPLFVAEFDPNLSDLENPTLMREFGLVLANADGLEDPANKFVMRSVSHTLGLALSIQSDATAPPFERTGWGGDGAPGSGRLRDFATGAVTQHAPKTLGRVDGVDFVLPTEAELDAMEAFMLSLGRQNDVDIANMVLSHRDAERGRVLFLTPDSQNQTVQAGKCNLCHGNAGALENGLNMNFNTGVEEIPHPALLMGETLPRDGGFGAQPDGAGGFGNGTFNVPSLIEAADTPPYHHNNAAATLEDAIGFYDTPEFKQSPAGQFLESLDSGGQELSVEVDALAAFLRVLNVLENLRAADSFVTRAQSVAVGAGSEKLLDLALADVEDALVVLAEGELHEEDVVPLLESADVSISDAIGAATAADRDTLLDSALADTAAARDLMVVGGMPAAIPTASPSPSPTPIPTPSPEPVDAAKPVVSILTPARNSTVSGVVTIVADATDDIGVTKVVFKIGTKKIGQDTTAPFEATWDTTTGTDGLKKVKAIAIDASKKRKAVVNKVTVDNASASAPTPTPVPAPTASPAPPSNTPCPSWMCPSATPTPTPTPTPPPCTGWGCPSNPTPTPPPAAPTPTPGQVGPTPTPAPPVGPDPESDAEAEGTVASVNLGASTITINRNANWGGGQITITVVPQTVFKGSVSANLNQVQPGLFINAAFVQSTMVATQVETDFLD